MVPARARLAMIRSGSAENRPNAMACNTFGLTPVALYRFTFIDNVLQKGWHMPLKTAGLVTAIHYRNRLDVSIPAYSGYDYLSEL
jgi:hypothetical protein